MIDSPSTPDKHDAVTAKDVARAAGVSRAAVLRTFTPGASVSPATRKRVLTAAKSLGWQIAHPVHEGEGTPSGLVALVAADVHTPHRSQFFGALTERLQAVGKVATFINSDGPDDSVEDALCTAISHRAEAAFILSGMPDPSLADLCLRNGLRLVLINRSEQRAGSLRVMLDDERAGREAFAMLAEAGCKRPALASSRANTPSIRRREEGFRAAAGQDVIFAASGTKSSSYETGLALGAELFGRRERPDGVFCTTDLIACGLMDSARHTFGLRIPEDLSVIGFDDIPQAGWESYKLTTFAQPIDAMVGSCTDCLCSNDAELLEICISAKLVWRDTVRRTS